MLTSDQLAECIILKESSCNVYLSTSDFLFSPLVLREFFIRNEIQFHCYHNNVSGNIEE